MTMWMYYNGRTVIVHRGTAHRFFASLRMTQARVVVILSEAKDLYEIKNRCKGIAHVQTL